MVKLALINLVSIFGIQGAEVIPSSDHIGLILQIVVSIFGLFHIHKTSKTINDKNKNK